LLREVMQQGCDAVGFSQGAQSTPVLRGEGVPGEVGGGRGEEAAEGVVERQGGDFGFGIWKLEIRN